MDVRSSSGPGQPSRGHSPKEPSLLAALNCWRFRSQWWGLRILSPVHARVWIDLLLTAPLFKRDSKEFLCLGDYVMSSRFQHLHIDSFHQWKGCHPSIISALCCFCGRAAATHSHSSTGEPFPVITKAGSFVLCHFPAEKGHDSHFFDSTYIWF